MFVYEEVHKTQIAMSLNYYLQLFVNYQYHAFILIKTINFFHSAPCEDNIIYTVMHWGPFWKFKIYLKSSPFFQSLFVG